MHRIGQVVTLAAGVLLLLVGGVWPLLAPESLRALPPIAAWVGPLATAVGTALLATSVTEFHRFQQAKRMLGPHLNPVCAQFDTLITHLRQAVLDLRDGRLDSRTASVLLAEQTSIFESTLTQLEFYSGANARPSRSPTPSRPPIPGPGSSVGADRRLVPSVPMDTTRSETVECPYCGTEQAVDLGTNFGDSASPQCGSCGSRFHVHRDRYGEAYANPWGGASPFSFLCPNCRQFEFQVATGRAVRPRWCLECFARIWPHAENPQIVDRESRPLQAKAFAVLDGQRTVLECPSCHGSFASFIRYKGKLYAECHRCERLLEESAQGQAPNMALQPTAGAPDHGPTGTPGGARRG